jgi:hypothetical protein
LFTVSPLEVLSFEDIEAFCDLGLAESSRIEYKRMFNIQVSETIAAMGNTDGGLILVGIADGKDSGGPRGLPGKIEGLSRSTGPSPASQVISSCYAYLKPAWVPDMWEVEVPCETEPRPVVLVIRVDRDKAPAPIHHRERGTRVRLGDQNVYAEPQVVYGLMQASSARTRLTKEFEEWFITQVHESRRMTWCNLAVAVPMRRMDVLSDLDSHRINRLRGQVEEQAYGTNRVWVQGFRPLPKSPADPAKLRDLQLQCRQYPARVIVDRSENCVRFTPEPQDITYGRPIPMRNADPDRGDFFHLTFDSRGFIAGSVGISWMFHTLQIPDIHAAFYALADLFCSDAVKQCYPDALWEGSRFRVLGGLSGLPRNMARGAVTQAEYPADFSKEEAVWRMYNAEFLDTFDAAAIAMRMTAKALAWAGLMSFEDGLASLDAKERLSTWI